MFAYDQYEVKSNTSNTKVVVKILILLTSNNVRTVFFLFNACVSIVVACRLK